MDKTETEEESTWESLRMQSLRPGGFGEDRARIWPALLGVQPLSDPPPYSEVGITHDSMHGGSYGGSDTDPHPDERQIKLDTDRSFILYPLEHNSASRDVLQHDLHTLMVSLFRKRRSLHYFQGFHDIICVLFLTLPRPLHLPCAEKMAIHRVRDAMGIGLEPMLGLLRILRNLLKLIDPEYAELLENASPLPYHALSNLLTLFSHDVPTLPLIQHVWDFLLVREPVAVVWLAAAVILYRKESIRLLVEQEEEGMIHSLLSSLPELFDQEPECALENSADERVKSESCGHEVYRASGEQESPISSCASSLSDEGRNLHQAFDGYTGVEEPPALIGDPLSDNGPNSHSQPDAFSDSDSNNDDPGSGHAHSDTVGGTETSIPDTVLAFDEDTAVDVCSHLSSGVIASRETIVDSGEATISAQVEADGTVITVTSGSRSRSLSCGSRSSHQRLGDPCAGKLLSTNALLETATADESGRSSYHPCPSTSHSTSHSTSRSELWPRADLPSHDSTTPATHPPKARKSTSQPPPTTMHKRNPSHLAQPLFLPSLLRQADALLTTYPPSHTALRVYEIMGRHSVVQTWHAPIITKAQETPEKWQCDEYLESLVDSQDIVIPSPPLSPLLQPRFLDKKRAFSPSWKDTSWLYLRSIRLRLGVLTHRERRLLLAGALLVAVVAIALQRDRVPRAECLRALWEDRWSIVSSVLNWWGRARWSGASLSPL